MKAFFNVKKPQEVFDIIDGFPPLEQEGVALESALGRVLSQDIVSLQDLPGFARSTMDGYAVKARDTFGATESMPALLELAGEVYMGEVPNITVEKGKAVKIHTGGMLPDGADSVVMLEYCSLLDETTLEVQRSVAPLENIILADDDYKTGQCVLKKGHRLRPQDLGALAGMGFVSVAVHKKPVVAIISTGNEVVPADQTPLPGQVRDMNRYTFSALCETCGAVPLHMGICTDSFDALQKMVTDALGKADTIWISGGSSVGTRDITLDVLETLPDFKLLMHGVSVSPGKPTIMARAGTKPVVGLPGHVSSAMIVAYIFMLPLLCRLSGENRPPFINLKNRVDAILGKNIDSASGREEYVRVRLVQEGERLVADPIFGKSGLISPLVDADGLVCVDMNTEGLYEGQKVKVMLF